MSSDRIKREWCALQKEPVAYCSAGPAEDDLRHWKGTIVDQIKVLMKEDYLN